MFFVTIVTRNRLPRAVHWTQPNQSVQFRKEEDMKKDAALGFVVVVVFVAILLVVFCWVDGIPAVNAIASLIDVMR